MSEYDYECEHPCDEIMDLVETNGDLKTKVTRGLWMNLYAYGSGLVIGSTFVICLLVI